MLKVKSISPFDGLYRNEKHALHWNIGDELPWVVTWYSGGEGSPVIVARFLSKQDAVDYIDYNAEHPETPATDIIRGRK